MADEKHKKETRDEATARRRDEELQRQEDVRKAVEKSNKEWSETDHGDPG